MSIIVRKVQKCTKNLYQVNSKDMKTASMKMYSTLSKFNTLLKEHYCVKLPKYGVFSGPYFPAFGLNTERYRVSLLILSLCRKIRTRKKLRIWTLFTQWHFGQFCLFFGSLDYLWSYPKGKNLLNVKNKENRSTLMGIFVFIFNSQRVLPTR